MSIDLRSRMISFRLSEEEYENIRDVCFTQGMPSVSEMARLAMNLLLQQPQRVPAEALNARVQELESRVHHLAAEMKKFSLAVLPSK